ncbi:unnamed protein product, partial [Vitis vinifera]
MGIQKIGRHVSGVSSNRRRVSSSSNVDNMVLEENQASGTSFEDDSDDCEFAEVRCELGMVEGQLCNIPFELYDLPDLREILSLDTWNSCLTEDERFYLSSYLPDMDQQTFWLTMKELLGGSDIFFGSPLDIFFNRLKGGFYPPKVAWFREGLQFLQRIKYYHSLRFYHDSMTQMFINMRKIWAHCEMSTGVEERIYLWTRKKRKVTDLLDLNTYPEDGFLLGKEVNPEPATHQLSRQAKSVKSRRENKLLLPLVANGKKSVAPKSGGKGFLKMKASVNGSSEKHNGTLEQSYSAPRGVLKMVHRVPSMQPKHSRVVSTQQQSTLLVKDLPVYTHQWDAGGFCETPFLWQKVGCGEVHRTSKQPWCIQSQQESEHLRITTGSSRHPESIVRKVKRERNPSLDDTVDLGEHKLCGGDAGIWKGDKIGPKGEHEPSMDSKETRCAYSSENLRQSLGMEDTELPMRSLACHPFGVQCYEQNWHIEPMQKGTIMQPGIPAVMSGIPDIGNEEQEKFMVSSNQMKNQVDVGVGGSEKLYKQPSALKGFQNDLVLPLTYKRRKTRAKLNSTDSVKPLTVGADLKSATPKEANRAKAVKIMFKGWKEQKSHFSLVLIPSYNMHLKNH